MPIYNRPEYLKSVLKALVECESLDKFYVETFEEPDKQKENSEILKILKGKIKYIRNVNKITQGCAGNICGAINAITKQHDYFVLVEDDIVLSKDALNLALWSFPRLTDKCPAMVFHCKKFEKDVFENSEHKQVQKSLFFAPWGWAGKSSFFEKFLSSYNWKENKKKSWAMPLNIYSQSNDIIFLQSLIGRSQNIGAVGVFQKNPKNHRKYCYNDYYYTGKPIKDFTLIDGYLEIRQKEYYQGGHVYSEYKKFFKEGVLR